MIDRARELFEQPVMLTMPCLPIIASNERESLRTSGDELVRVKGMHEFLHKATFKAMEDLLPQHVSETRGSRWQVSNLCTRWSLRWVWSW